MAHIFQEAHQMLSSGEKIVMLEIIRHAGSSPRTTGARMLLRADGTPLGTIGGGLLEAEAIQLAREALSNGVPCVRGWNFDGKKAGEMGMICGGQVEVLIQPLFPAPQDQDRYQQLSDGILRRSRTFLVTHLDLTEDGSLRSVDQAVLAGGSEAGLPATPFSQALGEYSAGSHPGNQPGWVRVADRDYLVEAVADLATAYLFGAGHVSQMLASLTGWVGFSTVVIDDRAEFANRVRFPQADTILAPGTFEAAFRQIEVGADSYLVIVTRGHADDLKVADWALRTPASYIGMIGSRRKRELVFHALLERGYSPEDLARIHSPIGTDIGAETPEEIAISIVGELIKARAGLL
ncbi:MAG TPA: XdhC/CoxI family protein [Anaerolineaceae bacterium]